MSDFDPSYPHLLPALRPIMADTPQVRARFVQTPRWIGYPQATEIHDRMEYLRTHERMHRMPNLMVVGDTNNGKTLLARHFVKRHPAVHDPALARTTVPVLFVKCPATPEIGEFYDLILDALFAPYRPKDSVAIKRKQVVAQLQRCELELLIIDEIHNVLSGYVTHQRKFLSTLRSLGGELRLPMVAFGTIPALRAINVDPQLGNRFDPMPLPRWRNDDAWRMLLKQYERILPLAQPSQLSDPEMASRLFGLSEGFIGELAKLLKLATETALAGGLERIDAPLLGSLKWSSPSQRRGDIEKLTR